MKDLIAQFLIEARDLIGSAADDLLALEASPGDAAALDRAFRAFHTLKGSVGLFDYPPLLAVLHAAEDGLGAARAGTRAIDAALTDRLLAILDATACWTEAIATAGALPAGAADEAGRLVAHLRGAEAPRDPAAPAREASAPPDWVLPLLDRAEAAPAGAALLALRYRPHAECFFTGDDPLGLVRRLPGLLALRVTPAEPWPCEGEVDVYRCNLDIALLTADPPESVDAVFRLVRDQVTLVPVAPRPAPARPSLTTGILAEQMSLLATAGDPDGEAGRHEAAARAAANALRAEGRTAAAEAVLAAARDGAAALAERLASLGEAGPASWAAGSAEVAGGPDRTLRIEADRLDALVALTGDLVVARNALNHLAGRAEAGIDPAALSRALRESDARIGQLVGELHRGVTALTLLPLATVFRRFARPLREIARGLGKEVALTVEGGEVGADKAVADALFEPLLHVLRNAVDHGLESPDERRLAGKSPTGRITLRAALLRGRLAVSVSDDGRGIDPALIRRRAGARGLHGDAALATMSDAAAIDLIFTPGFSTAERVSDLSGRGIGMDAVRAAMERLGGQVSVESRVGAGTTIRLLLAQTIALTRIMLVSVGPERYGVPLSALAEVAQVPRARIRDLGPGLGAAVSLRGRTVPVLGLGGLLGLPAPEPGDGTARLLVVQAGPEIVALEVDRFGERLDVLTRPLAGLAAAAPGFCGTTLLGDGRILLVLDPPALVALAGGPAPGDIA
ncbi:chemotaxis protein CheA [Methylobacterium sp. ID0610]|uniref:chemotaxis protein CheA n=1 Tax=Methylobacterium carpenticola TaxID=3344827 RepID=UPI0036A3FFFA